jgi:predicted metal-dependent phosphoesterase TrpH
VIALTDHDTLSGVPDATAAGDELGVRVISGCEFSARARWGEMHLLAYFLPSGGERVELFLREQRGKRRVRAEEMVGKLGGLGVPVTLDEVLAEAGGGAVGRPHVARALVGRGHVPNVPSAFHRYIGWRRPAFVPKDLPEIEEVTVLVRGVGGVTSAAHLGDRATRGNLERLLAMGVDGVEVWHPIHDDHRAADIDRLAEETGMLRTGGTDWHGEPAGESNRAPLGSIRVPEPWLVALDRLNLERRATEAGG